MADTLLKKLLEEEIWDGYADWIAALKGWPAYPLLLEALDALDVSALYESPIHGQDHIERTLLFAALTAQGEGCEEEMVRQLFGCASYHDVGRQCDFYETGHGARSAQRLQALTGQTGERLREMEGAVAAHSWPDEHMEEVVRGYAPADLPRALELTKLLKDADGLDRVRIDDLSAKFMRHETARRAAQSGLAQFVYNIYRARLDLPFFSLKEWRSRKRV